MILRIGKSRISGFTLIELTLVVVIVGILFALVIPYFPGLFATTKLRVAARDLTGTLIYARYLAITERVNHRVNYDLDREEYWISKGEKDSLNSRGVYSKLRTSLGRTRALPEGVKIKDISTPRGEFSGGKDYTTFNPDGSAELSSLHLQNKEGNIHTVIILKTTGRVKTYNYEKNL